MKIEKRIKEYDTLRISRDSKNKLKELAGYYNITMVGLIELIILDAYNKNINK